MWDERFRRASAADMIPALHLLIDQIMDRQITKDL
jgi:hypothetical protein